jgi:hypothetical protein
MPEAEAHGGYVGNVAMHRRALRYNYPVIYHPGTKDNAFKPVAHFGPVTRKPGLKADLQFRRVERRTEDALRK